MKLKFANLHSWVDWLVVEVQLDSFAFACLEADAIDAAAVDGACVVDFYALLYHDQIPLLEYTLA
ncbi:hypothetical protein BpHYR1_016799 [Brachionus plicatilis]|uniref:Uncharacterized protein n=1 Tax=Brachionus plicatilis TaxID=10195 RepID=A0A3M7RLJ0_BRAPC|nr:hypothetical protein BpHYR1_016799 [Brachionus plicatilis]